MTDDVKHECGVAAVYCLDGALQAARLLPGILTHLQNRGQLSAGLTSFRADRDQLIDTHRDVGEVREVFRLAHPAKQEALMQRYAGTAAIGHVRYATSGADDASYAQPFERHHGKPWKWFSFCFNGNLANYAVLKERLTKYHYHITRETDTEIIYQYLSYELRGSRKPSLVRVFHNLWHTFDGAFNICFLNAEGELAVVRDPLGNRPLCYAKNDELFVAASESIPLTNMGFDDIRSLPPGVVALVRKGRVRLVRYERSPHKAHCFFEWIYFANVGSVLDDRSVYMVRANLGRKLAEYEKEDPREAIVVPVPDTAKPAADAMAFALGIPSMEGLLRNRYVGRTFIESTDREAKARQKYTPLREVLEGRKILLVEDSVVRCTTLHALIHQLRTRGGAREIHVRVASPPIYAPCFYGIDMASVDELYAPKFLSHPYRGPLPQSLQRRLARDVGADSFFYLPIESIPECIGLPEEDLCLACVTGKYPTPYGNRMYRQALDLARKGIRGRAHELAAGTLRKAC